MNDPKLEIKCAYCSVVGSRCKKPIIEGAELEVGHEVRVSVDHGNVGLGLPAFGVEGQHDQVRALYVPVKGHEGRASLDKVSMGVVRPD